MMEGDRVLVTAAMNIASTDIENEKPTLNAGEVERGG
jgi:hypothetical protein